MGPLPLVLTAVALAKKPPKTAKAEDKPPVAAPDPSPPKGDLDPAIVPKVDGPESVLALEGLHRDTFSFTFSADTAPLSELEPAELDAVFAELAADPNWRVTRDAGGRVAWRRDEAAGFVVGVDGWQISGTRCSRVGLREATAVEPAWTSSPRVAKVAAGAASIALQGFRPDGAVCGSLATALRVEGDLTLEVYEAAPDDERPVTFGALGELPYHVANLAFAAKVILAEGFDPFGLPESEPLRVAQPTITVSAAAPGHLLVRARVNPGEPGWTWLRILGSDGQPWHEAEVARATLEMPGWSHDPTHGFYLQSTVPASPGPAFSGTAELWFQGADGPPRRLHADPVSVPAR